MPAFETPAAPQRKNAPRRKALFDKLRRARRLRRGRAFFVLTRRGIHGMINYAKLHGEMSERFMELVLKTSDSSRAKGSNPFLSANFPSGG